MKVELESEKFFPLRSSNADRLYVVHLTTEARVVVQSAQVSRRIIREGFGEQIGRICCEPQTKAIRVVSEGMMLQQMTETMLSN